MAGKDANRQITLKAEIEDVVKSEAAQQAPAPDGLRAELVTRNYDREVLTRDPVRVLGYTDAGIVYDAGSGIKQHPYGEAWNKWLHAYEARITTIEAAAPPSPAEPPRGTVCVCGLAKEYHDPRHRPANLDPKHEYQPRYRAEARPPEGLDARIELMQVALGGAGVIADGLNSWSAARAVIDHLDALACAGKPFASVARLSAEGAPE